MSQHSGAIVRSGWRAWLLVASLWLVPVSPASALVDLAPGVSEVQFSWPAANGPVIGYFVYASINGAADVLLHAVPTTTSLPIEAAAGDTVSIRVVAFDVNATPGPSSDRSETVRFNAAVDTAPQTDPAPAPEPDPAPDPAPAPDPQPAPDPAPTSEPRSAASPDFDADGNADIIVRNADTEQVRMWAMQGSTIREDRALARLGSRWKLVGNGDYDGDGNSDVLLFNDETGVLDVWLIDDLSLVGGTRLTTELAPWEVAATGDFDGNGADDIVLVDSESNRLAIWALVKGEPQVLLETSTVPGSEWTILGTGDYDGDGLDDLVWSDGANAVEIWLMDASVGVLEAGVVSQSKRASWELAAIADVNFDGRDDLVWRDARLGRLYVWSMNGTDVTAAGRLDLPAKVSEFAVVGAGDYNGDGPEDLLMREINGESVFIVFMRDGKVDHIASIEQLAAEWDIDTVGSEALTSTSDAGDATTTDSTTTRTPRSVRWNQRR